MDHGFYMRLKGCFLDINLQFTCRTAADHQDLSHPKIDDHRNCGHV